MRALLARLRRDRSGNMLVELAFVAPFLVAVTLGLVDFGRGTYASMSLRSAARVGAEYVSRTNDPDGAVAVVASAANIKPDGLVVTPVVFCECSSGTAQTCGTACPDGTGARRYIAITAAQPFSTLIPYPLVSNPMTLSGRAILRVQ
jgi:Flp pilus assembly protein TadG